MALNVNYLKYFIKYICLAAIVPRVIIINLIALHVGLVAM
jgi:hypothetical protein